MATHMSAGYFVITWFVWCAALGQPGGVQESAAKKVLRNSEVGRLGFSSGICQEKVLGTGSCWHMR